MYVYDVIFISLDVKEIMENPILILFLGFIAVGVFVFLAFPSTEESIPPTSAYAKLITSNATLKANTSYSAINITGRVYLCLW